MTPYTVDSRRLTRSALSLTDSDRQGVTGFIGRQRRRRTRNEDSAGACSLGKSDREEDAVHVGVDSAVVPGDESVASCVNARHGQGAV